MIALILLFSGQSQASELSMGLTLPYNDPFVRQTGHTISGTLQVAPRVRASLMASAFGDPGESGWTPLTKQLVEEHHVSPDISKLASDLSLTVGVEPVNSRVGRWPTAFGLYGGAGIVQTADDLEALQTTSDDERAISTQFQTHASQVWGLYADMGFTDMFGLRLRWHHVSFIETVNGTTLELKGQARANLEAVLRFGSSQNRGGAQ